MTNEISIELDGVAEQIANGSGFWRSCSGCHEHNEGVALGPWSYVFQCNLGMGCHECGGLGAVWDNVDYSGYGEDLTAAPASAEPVCSVAEMKTSAGMDYFVSVRVGDREITPHMFKERWKAEYEVAEWKWLLLGGEKPDLMAYGPDKLLTIDT